MKIYVNPNHKTLFEQGVLTEKQLYFIYLLAAQTHDSEKGFVNMYSKFIESFIGHNYRKQLEALRDLQIISIDEYYKFTIDSTEGICKSYKLMQTFVFDQQYMIQLSKQFMDRLYDIWGPSKRNNGFMAKVAKAVREISFKQTEALEHINKYNDGTEQGTAKFNALTYQVRDLCHQTNKNFDRRYCKVNSTNNRLDSNLTNMASELLQFIKPKEQGNLIQLDCRNSQPLLFLLEESKNNPSEDISNLLSYALNGKLYDHFAQLMGKTRDEVKKPFIVALYDELAHDNSILNVMKEKYPQAYQAIKQKKMSSNGILIDELKNKPAHARQAIYMQRLEADIWIQTILKRVIEQLGDIEVYTKHDSIIINEKYKEQVEYIIREVYRERYNVEVPLGMSYITKNTMEEEKRDITPQFVEETAKQFAPFFAGQTTIINITSTLNCLIARNRLRTQLQVNNHIFQVSNFMKEKKISATWVNFRENILQFE